MKFIYSIIRKVFNREYTCNVYDMYGNLVNSISIFGYSDIYEAINQMKKETDDGEFIADVRRIT